MPLAEMSPNVGTPEADGSRKRSHDEYADSGKDVVMADAPVEGGATVEMEVEVEEGEGEGGDAGVASSSAAEKGGASSATAGPQSPRRQDNPKKISNSNSSTKTPTVTTTTTTNAPPSSTSLATAATTATATATAQPSSSATQPPAKRKKLTVAEKEEKEREKQEKARIAEEKLKEKAKTAEEKAKIAEEKAKLAEERRLAKEEEQRKKDEKKAAKEEDQRKKDEALRKQQNRMASFFGAPKRKAAEEQAAAGEDAADRGGNKAAPAPAEKTEYEKRFQPFYVKAETKMATSPFALDEAERARRSARFDEYVVRQQEQDDNTSGWTVSGREIADKFRRPGTCRGISRRPVRFIMDKLTAAQARSDTTTEQQMRAELSTIPRKVIAFHEDVRPPYQGTLTYQPFLLMRDGMARLGRHPTSREMLPLHYDYDSEAEWADEEEGEDVDMDDDDEEMEEEDDMEGFLDDSEDAGAARHGHAFVGDMEPLSSGIWFEGGGGGGGGAEAMEKHRLEFVLDSVILPQTHSFDPFSTEYWPDPKASKPISSALTSLHLGSNHTSVASNKPATTSTSTSTTGPAPTTTATTPTTAAATLVAVSTNTSVDPARLQAIRPETLGIVKDTILENKELSKASLEEILAKRVPGITRLEARTILATLAYPVRKGRVRVWSLKEGV